MNYRAYVNICKNRLLHSTCAEALNGCSLLTSYHLLLSVTAERVILILSEGLVLTCAAKTKNSHLILSLNSFLVLLHIAYPVKIHL